MITACGYPEYQWFTGVVTKDMGMWTRKESEAKEFRTMIDAENECLSNDKLRFDFIPRSIVKLKNKKW